MARASQHPDDMKWSWKLGRWFGIDVFIHATFVLLLVWIAVASYLRERDMHATLVGVAFMLALFGSVLLHEFGHALVARVFGIRTRDITLLPIGGLARLERMPEKPAQELLVALAGPAVNLAIAGALYALLSTSGIALHVEEANLVGAGPFFARLLWVNLSLALFNLLPAFPMDGGRALRAILAFRSDYVRATHIAAKLGQGMALILGMLGLAFSPMLAFIALFVWIGAASEAAGVEAKAALEGLPTYSAMETRFDVLVDDQTLASATEHLLAGSQVDFPVVDRSGTLVGVLTRAGLIGGLGQLGRDAPVGAAMETKFPIADPAEMLDVSLTRLGDYPFRSMPVVSRGKIVGIVTAENIGELMLVRRALRASAGGHPGSRFAVAH